MNNENYLAHKGVRGMRWGVQNGPPYPLSRQDKFKEPGSYRKAMKVKGGTGSLDFKARRSDPKATVNTKRLNHRRKKENKLVRKITVAEYNRDSMHEQSKRTHSRAERREMNKLSKVYAKNAAKYQRKLNASKQKTAEIIKKLQDEGYDVTTKAPSKVTEAGKRILSKIFKSNTTQLYDYANQDIENRLNRDKYNVTKRSDKKGSVEEGELSNKLADMTANGTSKSDIQRTLEKYGYGATKDDKAGLKELVESIKTRRDKQKDAEREKAIISGKVDVKDMTDAELNKAITRLRNQETYLKLIGKETPAEAAARVRQEKADSLTKAIANDLKKNVVVPMVSSTAAYGVKRLLTDHTTLSGEAIDSIFSRVPGQRNNSNKQGSDQQSQPKQQEQKPQSQQTNNQPQQETKQSSPPKQPKQPKQQKQAKQQETKQQSQPKQPKQQNQPKAQKQQNKQEKKQDTKQQTTTKPVEVNTTSRKDIEEELRKLRNFRYYR